ncbi:MAG: hypothetical protein E7161_01145 [Firmicutes bacterium]|nr:hypothetical protein [Bacillota bacterium]
MQKIDITNSLYHAIMSTELGGQYEDYRYEKLISILKTGYIYSVNNLSKNRIGFALPDQRGINPDDYICLGCNPYSDIAHRFNNIYRCEMNGYNMSQLSFGFALNLRLLDELEYKPGSYDYEILVKDRISIKDYAIAIINAGGNISHNLVIYDWYMQYINGEITKDEYERKMFYWYHIPSDPYSWYMNKMLNSRGENFVRYIKNQLDKNADEFIVRRKRYETIKGILQKYKSELLVVDVFGEEIPSLDYTRKRIVEIKEKWQ